MLPNKVGLIVVFVVETFESVKAQFTLLHFKLRRIRLVIIFATSHKVSVVFGLMWAIILDTFELLNSVRKDCMIPFLALRYSRVHINISNCSNVTPYIKVSVDESFDITTALDIPYIKLDNGHIGFLIT